MNNIQKLIKELKVEKSRAKKDAKKWVNEDEVMLALLSGQVAALDLCIRKLTLLLNTGNEKQR